MPNKSKKMAKEELNRLWEMLGMRFKSHPWHGISIGESAPDEDLTQALWDALDIEDLRARLLNKDKS